MKKKITYAIVFAVMLVGVGWVGNDSATAGGMSKGKAGYLKSGAYLDENGTPVNMTWCSTGWVKVSGSDPARYFCKGVHWGSGPLAISGRSPKSGKTGEGGKGGYLGSGAYLDEHGNPVNYTFCTTGWVQTSGTNPPLYHCNGLVFGAGPLFLLPD